MSQGQEEIFVEAADEGKRLDFYLSQIFSEKMSRSKFKKLIEDGKVKIAGREIPAHHALKAGEKISVEWPAAELDETPAQDIPIEIIYEDNDLMLINKPPGMVVHPANGNPDQTLVNALLFHTNKKLSQTEDPIRPGIVHRLDKDTSGIMIIAKNDKAHAFLADQFKDRSMERSYRVVVKGVVQHEEGMCEEAIGRAFLNRKKIIIKPSGGRDAETYFRVIQRYKRATLLEVCPITGRTHQIRVHMAHMGHPVIGDLFYGVSSQWISRQAVHAFSLGFIHPRTRKKAYFECPIPEDMRRLIQHLEKE